MATERPSRRALLRAVAALGLLPLAARAAAGPQRVAAAWERAGTQQLGVLAFDGTRARVDAAIDLPGRAHGLWLESDGTLLVVARRPGDWLLRWRFGRAEPDWHWAEADRAFTGHVLASADGRELYTPETDLDSGRGLIGVRDARSLEKRDEWPTHGLDPHALLRDARGRLLVANGGIATQAESGRRKLVQQGMDPSLVRIDARSGELLGRWRLPDAHLSIRHLAWNRNTVTPQVGIALQAEHDDADVRAAAPLLALFDGRALTLAEARPLAGYGGDVAALGTGFVVSAPRAGGIAAWDGAGRFLGFVAQAEACALAADGDAGLWSGGRRQALHSDDSLDASAIGLPDLKLDNHWLRL